jgi:hypothetical protein
MLITHEFKWAFTKTRCVRFFGKLSLSDTQNSAYVNMVLGYLSWCELCDGFNVVEGYTILSNIKEPTKIEMVLVFRCQKQILCDEPMLMNQPNIESEYIDELLKIQHFF